MKKFNLYQIQLTNEIVDAVNAGETVPAFEMKQSMTMDFRGTKIGQMAGDVSIIFLWRCWPCTLKQVL